MRPPHLEIVAATLVAALVGAIVLLDVLAPPAMTEVQGVRLGFSATQVRAHFQASEPGQWQQVAGCSEPELVFQTGQAQGRQVEKARFAFHAGMLVKVGLRLTPEDAAMRGKPRLETLPRSVIVREVNGGRARLTWLARDCEQHAAELRQALHDGASR